MEKINVMLYGGKSIFGGRETPLEADIIYCDNCANCSIYKSGHCLRLRAPLVANTCKYGSKNEISGYTSKAKKYGKFKQTYQSDPMYGKIHNYPYNTTFAVVGDYYWLHLNFVGLEKDETSNQYTIQSEAFLAKSSFFILKEELTVELLHQLLSAKPRAMMGGIITEYQKTVVPNCINDIRKLDPDLYKKLCELDSKYLEYTPNYIGKYARINTLVIGSKIQDCHGNNFTVCKDADGKVYLEGTMTRAVPFSGASAYVKVYPKDDQTVEVRDNSWCDDNTIF